MNEYANKCPVCLAPAGYPCHTKKAMDGGYIRNLAYGLVAPHVHSWRLRAESTEDAARAAKGGAE